MEKLIEEFKMERVEEGTMCEYWRLYCSGLTYKNVLDLQKHFEIIAIVPEYDYSIKVILNKLPY